jgi:signal peptidase I
MSRFKGTLSDLGYWALIVSTALLTTLFLSFGVGFHALLSNSMAPEHPAGSVVITIQTSTEQLQKGDVIKLPLPNGTGRHYVHRIVEVDTESTHTTVVTKGDNNVAKEPWSLQILSTSTPRVIATIPLVGHLVVLTSPLWAQLLLASIVVGFVLVALLRAFWRPLKNSGAARHRAPEP